MQPKMLIPKEQANQSGSCTCQKCGKEKPISEYVAVKHFLFPSGHVNICNECIEEHLRGQGDEEIVDWLKVDLLCQAIDIPFIPKQVQRLVDINGAKFFPIYAKMMYTSEYERFGWKPYFDKYKELKSKDMLSRELPLINDSYYDDLRLRWGETYDNEELVYLENLYNGILSSYGVEGSLENNSVQKLCKISLEIDNRIRSGADFDKLIQSYDKLVKITNLTPSNTKADSDFSSMGEIVAWLEKRNWINPWYNDANKDIVDEVIHSSQAYVQRLYTNEAGIGEEVTERIEQLKLAAALDKADQDLEQKRLAEDIMLDVPDVDLEEWDTESLEDYGEEQIDEALESGIMGV